MNQHELASKFLSQFTSDILIGLVDKTITVLFVTALLYVLPAPIKERLYFAGRQPAPITKESSWQQNTSARAS